MQVYKFNEPPPRCEGVFGFDLDDTFAPCRKHGREYIRSVYEITDSLGAPRELVMEAHHLSERLSKGRLSGIEFLIEDVLRCAGIQRRQAEVLDAQRRYHRLWQEYEPQLKPFAGTSESLCRLATRFPRWARVVVTLCPRWLAAWRLHCLGLARYFHGIVSVAEQAPCAETGVLYPGAVAASWRWLEAMRVLTNTDRFSLDFTVRGVDAKPHPYALQVVQQWAGVGDDRCIFVGDNPLSDGLAAVRARWRYLFARQGCFVEPSGEWPPIAWQYDDIRDLPGTLEKMVA